MDIYPLLEPDWRTGKKLDQTGSEPKLTDWRSAPDSNQNQPDFPTKSMNPPTRPKEPDIDLE
jgi:hypothetical protein